MVVSQNLQGYDKNHRTNTRDIVACAVAFKCILLNKNVGLKRIIKMFWKKWCTLHSTLGRLKKPTDNNRMITLSYCKSQQLQMYYFGIKITYLGLHKVLFKCKTIVNVLFLCLFSFMEWNPIFSSMTSETQVSHVTLLRYEKCLLIGWNECDTTYWTNQVHC